MIFGVPYMPGLVLVCISLLSGMIISNMIGVGGWLFSLVAVPLVIFANIVCADDDKALTILALEVKWTFIKMIGGNSMFHGKTLTMSPISFGLKVKDVKRYFKKTVRD